MASLFQRGRFQRLPTWLTLQRIYVDQLGGGHTSDQMRDMIIAALQNSKLFAITENQDRADAVLRGSADDKVYTEDHQSSDSIGLHTNSSIVRKRTRLFGGIVIEQSGWHRNHRQRDASVAKNGSTKRRRRSDW